MSIVNEKSVPLHKLLSVTCWSLTGVLLLAGWVVYFANLADLSILLVVTAVLSALGGATATAKSLALDVARLMRLTFGTPAADTRPMRPVPGAPESDGYRNG